jgi:ABC-type multidrug transport system fused ATPase/permease subunit
MVGKTSFLITHDLRSVANVDLVLVLEDGRIVECGNHGDLMTGSSQYRRLYELKTGRREAGGPLHGH